jgi:hypothetical protein
MRRQGADRPGLEGCASGANKSLVNRLSLLSFVIIIRLFSGKLKQFLGNWGFLGKAFHVATSFAPLTSFALVSKCVCLQPFTHDLARAGEKVRSKYRLPESSVEARGKFPVRGNPFVLRRFAARAAG